MINTKKPINKHQHKLIVLISTLNYMNLQFKKYTQNDILYYFNKNMKQNEQKPAKLKTLQSYLYKLNKILGVTINYHRHLGVNMGTEVHYKLKYSKKECYRIINKHFREKKYERYQNRINSYIEKNCIKNSNVEKEECYNNNNNKKKRNKKSIEKSQVKKYAKKCHFKSNTFLSILNLDLEKTTTIEILKILKKTENFFQNNTYNKNNNAKLKKNGIKTKQHALSKILNKLKINLADGGKVNKQLETYIQNIHEQYKYKPHFIIENNKYNDLKTIIERYQKSVKHIKTSEKKDEEGIKNNIFSILFDQLKHEIDIQILVPILKNYLNKQKNLEYKKIINNHYYYELSDLIKNAKDYLKIEKYEKITS
ncbi:plasmid maintenance protein [Borrelia coriaceae]|uniref:plasmid maintenance protein n=1 Tax=Borrelia coriaceae TaxID=144 RepID=UPI0004800C16|nr:plasmid maintenance protein [Borrelia coriaceae]